jgi:hypothetical protein
MKKDWAAIAEAAWSAPGWHDAAAKYHKQRATRTAVIETDPERLTPLRKPLADDVSLVERAWSELNHRDHVAAATLQAAEYLVRQGDIARFREWLASHGGADSVKILKYLEGKTCR